MFEIMRQLKDSIDKNEAVIELDLTEQHILYNCLNELRDFRWGDKNDFCEYQKQAIEFDTERFAIGQEAKWRGFVEKALGLTGEAGEVAEIIKKSIRDQNMNLTEDDKEAIKLELGDVLWYLSAVSFYLGVSLEEVAKSNLEKLNSRKTRGKIHEKNGKSI